MSTRKVQPTGAPSWTPSKPLGGPNRLTVRRAAFVTAVVILSACGSRMASAQPANDQFSNARIISEARGQVSDTTVGATKEPSEPAHAGNEGGHSIWYGWTAPGTGEAIFDTIGSQFDTLLAVYTGADLGSLTVLAENDNLNDIHFSRATSRVVLSVTEGETYWIAIDGWGEANGRAVLNWAMGPPPNDDFISAPLLEGPNGSMSASTYFATKELGEPDHARDSGGHSIWYAWIAPATGQALFDTGGSGFDTLLAVYTGFDVQDLTLQAESDDVDSFFEIWTSQVILDVVENEWYWIAIDGYNGDSGPVMLSWASTAPPNDNFFSAEVLSGQSGTATGSTFLATLEFNEPNVAAGRTIWYEWSVTEGGAAIIDLAGSTFDTFLSVYTGESIDALTLVAQNDDFDRTPQSRVLFSAEPGITYRIAVDGYGFGEGMVFLSYDVITAPLILSQPESQSVLEEDNVTFSLTALGAPPLQYQWLFGGTNLPSATNATLALANVQFDNQGDYQAVVSNTHGAATSSVARLTVLKTSTPGVQRTWATRCDAVGGWVETATALWVDEVGHVYITGTSTASSGDYATAKLDSAGNKLWFARYNGPRDSRDIASALVVDSAGNAYVTGSSTDTNNFDAVNFATVKYGPNGNLLWVARYEGLDNTEDRPFAVALDDAGAVYVSATRTTIKYDANGRLVWTIRDPDLVASAMKLDPEGNVLLAGAVPDSNTRFATAKYSNDGRLLWQTFASDNGPGGPADVRATAMTVDGAGNTYVAGVSSAACCLGNENLAYLTAKYDPEGRSLWTVRSAYLAPIDRVIGIALDDVTNVCVTTESFGAVKYDRSGRQLWSARINRPGQTGLARAAAFDRAGNVYLAGSVWNDATTHSGYDYLTVKYDTNGNTAWLARYNSPDNGDDEVAAIGLDPDGNVHVAGAAAGCAATVKYAQSAAAGLPVITVPPRGVTVFPGATAVFTVSATSTDPLRYQWRHDQFAIPGATNSRLTLANVQLGDYGDYFVEVGNTAGTVTSSAARLRVLPHLVITSQPRSRDVIVDQEVEFRVDVTGEPAYYQWYRNGARIPGAEQPVLTLPQARTSDAGDYRVVITNALSAVTSAGARLTVSADLRQVWRNSYDGAVGGDDQVIDMKVDSVGNVYVTGASRGAGTWDDYATTKYGPAGEVLWVARYDGPGHNTDTPQAVAIDSVGNSYVTGASWGGSTTGFDMTTIKYDANGNSVWITRYNSADNGEDAGMAITVDEAGYVYVAGYTTNSASGFDYVTVKYDGDGNQIWAATYDGPGSQDDFPLAIAVDHAGNVDVTGVSFGGPTGEDYATLQYDPNGNLRWVTRYNGPGNGADRALALALDPSGNPYVTGRSFGSGTASDYATIKYSVEDGTELWVARYNGPGNNNDIAFRLAIDRATNVFVTGASYGGTPSSFDLTTIKYTSAGDQEWVSRYSGPGAGYDIAFALAVDAAGQAYAAGYSSGGPSTTNDLVVIKYATNGTPLWVFRYDGAAHLDDYAEAIFVDDAGSVYVAGESRNLNGNLDTLIMKCAQNTRPTVRLTAPADGVTFFLPTNVLMTASVSDSDGRIERVEYFNRTNQIGEAIAPPFAFNWTNAPSGTAVLTARATDEIGATATSAPVTVRLVMPNQPPSFMPGPDQLVLEDASAQTVPKWATNISPGPSNEISQSLTFLVSNSRDDLFSVPPALSADGTLTYTPAAQANGTATITVLLRDNGGTNFAGRDTSPPVQFTIHVLPVNDAPSFVRGPDLTVHARDGLQRFPGWATALSAGPADEAGQVLSFQVAASPAGLFAAQPVIEPDGTLIFTPAPNGSGAAALMVQIRDDGGTANGGVDVSPAQFCIITVLGGDRSNLPRLIEPTRLAAGQFRCRLLGAKGDYYTIEASTNLVNWIALTNLATPSGSIEWTDFAAAGFDRRFYRAVARPQPVLLPPMVSANRFLVRLVGAPGSTNQLQRAERFGGTWVSLGDLVMPPSGFVEFWETNPPSGQGFYRAAQH